MVNDIAVELHYDGVWNDITADVRYDPAIGINWGRSDEASRAAPSSMSLTLDNTSGKYSPRHPGSALFGKIGRNTPIRVLLGPSQARLGLEGSEASYVDTPTAVAIEITGDIDVRADVHPDGTGWRPPGSLAIARKYNTNSDQRSWALWVTPTGELRFRWSPDGTFTNSITATSTVAIPDDDARRAVRVTLDVNNGAAQHEVKFWTAPDIAGNPWTQLGATITTAGVTSIFAGSAPLEVGRVDPSGIGTAEFSGDLYAFELRSLINGTLVADLDMTGRAGDTSWTDSVGRVWTVHGVPTTVVTDPAVRFAGEVSSWPARWDTGHADIRVPIEAAGIRRRLGQGVSALRSSLYRGMTSTNVTTPVGYWPMEDGKDSTSIASAFTGHAGMSIAQEVELAAFSDAPASDAIPTVTTGHFNGRVVSQGATTWQRFMLFVDFPDTLAGEATLFQFITTGSARQWRITVDSVGDIRIRAWDADSVNLTATVSSMLVLGKRGLFWLLLTQNGANVDWQVGQQVEGDTGFISFSGTVAGHTKGNIVSFRVGPFVPGTLNGAAVGHVVVLNSDPLEIWDIAPFARAWSGETAVERVTRLAAEEEVPLRVIGESADSQIVGAQQIDTFLELVDAAADVDQGIMVDDRDALRLLYRTGASLYNQTPAVVLDYSAGDVAPPLEPVDDDQLTRNDITVSRPGGSSAREELLVGALSVQNPPDGVGRYDESVELNVFSDGDLPFQAGWLLHLGTIDEPRYPKVTVDLTAVPGLVGAATGVEPGDRVQISNPPAWLPPETIDQLAQGGKEMLTPHLHGVEWNTTPASPWTVGVLGVAGTDRVDTDGSETAGAFTSGTSTSLSVAITEGPLWTTTAAEFPFHVTVAGVVLNVTAISGAASPQTFTVDATPVNGVAKAIPVGSDVRLTSPMIIGL